MGKERITLRLAPSQMRVLEELRDALGVSISLILRTIVLDWLTQNEETLERIVSGEQEYNSPFKGIKHADDDDDEISETYRSTDRSTDRSDFE